jgi:hypothetical protein
MGRDNLNSKNGTIIFSGIIAVAVIVVAFVVMFGGSIFTSNQNTLTQPI